jgi:hypothetical protein
MRRPGLGGWYQLLREGRVTARNLRRERLGSVSQTRARAEHAGSPCEDDWLSPHSEWVQGQRAGSMKSDPLALQIKVDREGGEMYNEQVLSVSNTTVSNTSLSIRSVKLKA